MKIMQINAISDSGSTGRTCQEMNEAFRAMGHDAVVAFSVGTVTDESQEYKIGVRRGQQIHALLSRITGLQGYYSTGATRKLLKFMDTYHPDVVILRNLHANYIHVPMLLKYLAKKDVPTVVVLHDCWLYTGKCCHYTAAGCYRWQEKCGNCPAKKNYNKSWFFDRSAKMLRDKKRLFQAIPRLGVAAVSQWILEEAKKSPVLQNAVIMEQIYNWIDTEKFHPGDGVVLRQKLGIQDKKVILSIANTWSESKGIQTVLDVAKQLRDDEIYVLVGELPANTVLPANVITLPRSDDISLLVELYSMADVFLQTSLEETFGKVAAEALACGTPVVCFDSTANPELVREGCGFVVAVGDVDAMLRAIRTVLTNGKAAYSRFCRYTVQERFNIRSLIEQYMDFFQRLQVKKGAEKNIGSIVQINAVCGKGSTGKIVLAVNELLQEKGVDNYVLYSCGDCDHKNSIKYTTRLSIRIHTLISRICGNYGFENKSATRNLISQLKKIQPEIIHLHNIHSHDCDLGMLFKYIKENHIKVYWTFHDCWAFTGYCPHFDMVGCERWKTGCGNCPQMKNYSWIFDRSKKNFRKKKELLSGVDLTIITPSQWLSDLVQESFLKDRPIKVINNGIDLSVFRPRESHFREKFNCKDKFIILGVSFGWSERKGLDVFVELAQKFDEKFQIVLVGTNDYVDRMLPNNIISIHRTSNQAELAEIYTASDLLVNPTREESYPTVNMEALACGTPVLTFKTGGSPEMIDKTCGSVVPKDDVKALCREIWRIAETRPYSIESCLAKAKGFDMQERFSEYVELYKE